MPACCRKTMSRIAAEIRQGPSFTDVWLKLAKRREIDPLLSPDGPVNWQVNTCALRAKQSETRIPGEGAASSEWFVLSAAGSTAKRLFRSHEDVRTRQGDALDVDVDSRPVLHPSDDREPVI